MLLVFVKFCCQPIKQLVGNKAEQKEAVQEVPIDQTTYLHLLCSFFAANRWNEQLAYLAQLFLLFCHSLIVRLLGNKTN